MPLAQSTMRPTTEHSALACNLTWRLHISDASSARARLASAMASSSSAASLDARCSAADACSALRALERAAGCGALNAAPPAPYACTDTRIVYLVLGICILCCLQKQGRCAVSCAACNGWQHAPLMVTQAAPS